MTTPKRAFDRIPLDVQEKYAHLDLLNTVIKPNLRYIDAHGIGEKELERWQQTINDWATYLKIRGNAKVPLPGDRVVLTATGSIQGTTTVYEEALIDGKRRGTDELSICTKPMVPFLDMVGFIPHINVSGGYFGHLPAEALKYKKIAPGAFQFWGDRPRADGALGIQLPVYWWTVTSDKFY